MRSCVRTCLSCASECDCSVCLYFVQDSCAQFFLTFYDVVVVGAVDGGSDGDDLGGASSGLDCDVGDGAAAGIVFVVVVVVIVSNNVPS